MSDTNLFAGRGTMDHLHLYLSENVDLHPNFQNALPRPDSHKRESHRHRHQRTPQKLSEVHWR